MAAQPMSGEVFSWSQLPKPFWVLGPMEEITDAVFRRLVWELGAPHVFVTEFVRVEQVPIKGSLKKIRRLGRVPETPGVPLVAQIYGTRPAAFYELAKRLQAEGWAGIDINMGCPARQVRNSGAGSGLIKTPALAREIFWAVRAGAPQLPVSIKTRLGFERSAVEEWLGFLLELQPDALTVHARTAVQLYGGSADWNQVTKVVELRNRLGISTPIIGNGDLQSVEQGVKLSQQVGCEGLMAARAVVSQPWFWSKRVVGVKERLEVAQRHLALFAEYSQGGRNPQLLKKFFLAYLSGTEWFATNREYLVKAQSLHDFLCLFSF
jgi:tRNA-dihydrouridine synthase